MENCHFEPFWGYQLLYGYLEPCRIVALQVLSQIPEVHRGDLSLMGAVGPNVTRSSIWDGYCIPCFFHHDLTMTEPWNMIIINILYIYYIYIQYVIGHKLSEYVHII